jgi:hypothetical protein
VSHSIIKDLNNSETDEISNSELKKKTVTRMINEIKKDMYKYLN